MQQNGNDKQTRGEASLAPSEKLFVEQLTQRLRQEEREQGHLIAAISYKRSLVERFGIETAFQIARQHLRVPDLDVLIPRNVVSLKDAARRSGFVHELWAGGRPFVHSLPRVRGEGDHLEQHGISRSGYLTCLEDVLVRGRSAVVMKENEAIVDFETDELQRFADSPEQEPGVLYAAESVYWTMDPRDPPEIIDEAFMLSGCHANDFGHWLQEYLPKLAIALLAGLPDVPILVDERIPRTHLQSIELFCPGSTMIVIPHLAPRRVRRLWCASNPTYRGWYPSDWTSAWEGMVTDPQNFATTINKLTDLASNAIQVPTGFDRVFLGRRPTKKKKLVNHRQIEAVAEAKGFRVVYPEDLSFVEQMSLARHARHIIAPDGSNGLLSYFAGHGAKVCFLNHPHTLPLAEINGLLEALRIEFTIFTGPFFGDPNPEPYWNDYLIDETDFERFLSEWLAENSAAD